MADTIPAVINNHRRRRPLTTCGTSILTVLQNIYRKTLESNTPISTLLLKLASFNHDSFTNILIYVIQYQWLAILSFADELILSMENFIESKFPSSRYVFDRLDNMARVSETLPEIFDDVMRKFPVWLHKVPFLEWIVICVIEWMNFVVGALCGWGMEGDVKEKDINVVDESSSTVSCPGGNINTARLLEGFEDCNMGISPSSGLDRLENVMNQIENESNMVSSAASSVSGNDADQEDSKKSGLRIKCSYKEALEKGSPEKGSPEKGAQENGAAADHDMNDHGYDKEAKGGSKVISKKQTKKKKSETGMCVNVKTAKVKEDPILELFETGWQTPKKEGQTPTLLGSRSASYN